MKLIVGLGNPGKEYENTYHNLGFWAIDELVNEIGGATFKSKKKSLYSQCDVFGKQCILLKPQTFMNASGESVLEIANFYKIKPCDIIVFVDDIDLPLGTVRFREHGSGGTHNGLRSIVSSLASEEFARIKIGTGRDERMDLGDFVLSKIAPEKRAVLLSSVKEAISKLKGFVCGM